jgi:hypothetical protein
MVGVLTSTLTIRHFLEKTLLAFLIILFFLASPALGSQQSERKKILVLFSFRPTLPVDDQALIDAIFWAVSRNASSRE